MMRVATNAAATPRPSSKTEKTGRRKYPTSVGYWPWAFIGLLMLGVAVFYYYPIVKNIVTSFQQTNAFGGNPQWVGLANYEKLLTRPDLFSAIGNTLLYTGIVLLGIPIAVLIASMIELPGLKYKGLYRAMYFMPYLAMPMAVAQVWKIIYNGHFGLLNQFLRAIGIQDPPFWLTSPGWVMLAVASFGLWGSIGFNVIICSAGLKTIPKELYEAAAIDGASSWQQFRKITIPLLSPSIFFLTIMTTIGGFQLFDGLYALLGGTGNPAEPSSRSLVYLFYTEAFVNNDPGLGAAVAIVILCFVAAVTAIQFLVQKKWVHYV
ncbi:carbohydrate ABC transporter permease [Trueperella pyogenes]|uniref:carbohydrate ABC transporter permease n=1 Tax=Trueperella pyogenes TaxID=1661 RepID=UPI001558977B|nr:sugar ABC transporter permease [Trueperella pyogenes]MBB3025931.1 multiple sugar transport system permease protein [Trueperella pyogenes]MDF2420922.1 sugar ABC transporter permease [Trueperella pyogenes]UVJ55632.1 sugar ABC transporter permease [Trueperella pyogenes]WHU57790.1 sugar ABC transporter permease [Trueperella pyogenes]